MKIGIVIGSIREGRKAGQVGRWAESVARENGFDVALIDLKTFEVPLLTSATPPNAGARRYTSPNVERWSRAIDACDGFVFITAEYNHGVPGAFKNAVDSLGPEWTGKPLGFISYGSVYGIRAVEQWRQIVATFQMHDVRAQVAMSLFTDFAEDGSFTPLERRAGELVATLSEVSAAAPARRTNVQPLRVPAETIETESA